MRAPRPPLGGVRFGERQRREREIGAGERRRRQHRERIQHHMAAGRAELVGDVGAEDARLHGRGVRLQRELDQPRVGLGVLAERDDAADARRLRLLLQPRELRIVAVDDRRAARLDALEDFRLGVGDGFDRGEEFQMHRLDGGDDRDMRAHQPASAARSRRRGSCPFRTRRSARSAGSAPATAARPSGCCRRRPRHGSRRRATARAAAPPWCRSCRPSR